MSQLFFTKNLVSQFNIGEDMVVFINTKKANFGTKNLKKVVTRVRNSNAALGSQI